MDFIKRIKINRGLLEKIILEIKERPLEYLLYL
jgi:hypothetical protein